MREISLALIVLYSTISPWLWPSEHRSILSHDLILDVYYYHARTLFCRVLNVDCGVIFQTLSMSTSMSMSVRQST
jgi:hypothetical protein